MAGIGNIRHGNAKRGKKTQAYRAWTALRCRCNSETNARFAQYGGRGISVCDRWSSFENFIADMGEPGVGQSIDRINNDGNYEPSNCRWADVKTQNLNRPSVMLIELNGKVQSMADWCRELGVVYRTACWRARKYNDPKAGLLSLIEKAA